MAARSRFCLVCVPAAQRVDQSEMFKNGAFIALALVGLVPLKMIVEHQRNDLLELLDEAICDHAVDRGVKFFIQG